MNNWFLFCTFTVGFLWRVCLSECVWNINKDLPYKDPIFFRRNSRGSQARLVLPSSEKGLQLGGNEAVEVFCPGTGNYVHQLGRDEVGATCVSGTEIKIDGLKKTVKDLECTKSVSGDVQNTNRRCAGNKGSILSIGYNSPAGWLQLIEVCYDHGRSIPLYARHTVYGSAIGGAFVGNDRPGFKSSGLPTNVSLASAYKQKTHVNRFTRLLGKDRTNYYINKSNFLSRGHLAPDADFLFHSWQRSTYFYANVVPQWQNINGGNWGRLERSIRNAAKSMNQVFNVWTGTDGTLELNDENNNKVEMFLIDKDNLPIPKYTWKIVCTVSKNCIAFVVFNHPFDKNDEFICNDVCRDTNWYQDGYSDVSKGVVLCCEIKDLTNIFKTLPNVNVKGVLTLK